MMKMNHLWLCRTVGTFVGYCTSAVVSLAMIPSVAQGQGLSGSGPIASAVNRER